MEGDLKVAPGTTLKAGYDFTLPGNKQTFNVTLTNPQVVFTVRCVSGATPSQPTLTVPMSNATYTAPDSQWYPSGDQHSDLVYQGAVAVPDLCSGGKVRFDKGGTFSAFLSISCQRSARTDRRPRCEPAVGRRTGATDSQKGV